MVEEAMAKSANPHLPREEERTKKALTARIVLLGSDEMRAAMRGLIELPGTNWRRSNKAG